MNQTETQMNQLFDDEVDPLDQRPDRDYADILPLSAPASTELDYQPGMDLRIDPAAGLLGEILRGGRTISSGIRGNPVTPREATEAMLAITGGSALATRPAGVALASGLGRRVRDVVKNAEKEYEKAFKLADKATTPGQWQDSIKKVVKDSC